MVKKEKKKRLDSAKKLASFEMCVLITDLLRRVLR